MMDVVHLQAFASAVMDYQTQSAFIAGVGGGLLAYFAAGFIDAIVDLVAR